MKTSQPSSIKSKPHFELPATELARWLDRQGADRWWSVDGDPFLTGRMLFPCPGNELADQLRETPETLLLWDKEERPETKGQTIKAEDLDGLADRMDADRVFFLSWKGSDVDWLLIEDNETSDSEASSMGDGSSSSSSTGHEEAS